jgi:predicted dehydrogenase
MLGMHHPHALGLARQIAAHPDEFRLVAGWDHDAEVAAARRQEWGPNHAGFNVFESAEAVLDCELDGVVVEGHVHENVALARLVVERGLSVMLEKPAGVNLADCQALFDRARAQGLHIQLIYLFRYMSAVVEMLRLATSGALGEIYEFRARMPKDVRLYDEYVPWYSGYQGGMYFEMAGHMIDMMVTMLGRPERITPFLAQHRDDKTAWTDHGVAVFEYARAFGIIEVNALEIAPDARHFEVYGSGGACTIPNLGSGHLANAARQPLDVYLEDGAYPEGTIESPIAGWRRLALPAATLQITDLREFAASVTGEKEPEYSFEHDLIVHEALLRSSGVMASVVPRLGG